MSMNKTQLITVAAKLDLPVGEKETKESLIELIANHYAENDEREELSAFLAQNGLQVNENGDIVKVKRQKKLGENPNTKAYHTIKVLQDESLATLSYKELKEYLAESEGIETTQASIAWYANWMKQKGMDVVPRAKKPPVTEEDIEEAAAKEG